MSEQDEAALDYHKFPKPGKLEIRPTKPLSTQNDLALAYSPGVAAACTAITEDPNSAADYTARSNLVGVISNGSAVLGLGNIGALASKPVMEGKAVLFKKFSGIDVFDIEINQPDVDKFVEAVASLEPTFGGINLEDIKAPECFDIEHQLCERMNIPVFHDDQHGTAIIVAAAVLNGLKMVGKKLEDVRLVASGAGAAALACLNQLVSAGLSRDNILVTDRSGVIHKGRERLDKWKGAYAVETEARTLGDAIEGADIFLGLSGPGILTQDMVKAMAEKPLVLALANPVPEILPEEVREVRDDAVVFTGRSDYPNQVNNVLCFPFIFRGALDVGATTINEEMKLACVKALASLELEETSDLISDAYGKNNLKAGADYLIPKPFDPRLIVELSSAVAQAAMDSGVATRPINDMRAYRQKLRDFVYHSGFFMRPIFDSAHSCNKKLVYAEGEQIRVLQAAQQVVDEDLAHPVLIGEPETIMRRIRRLGLRLVPEQNIDIIDPHNNPYYEEHWKAYHAKMGRKGITPGTAQYHVRTQNALIAALMVSLNQADAMISGVIGGFDRCLSYVLNVVGKAEGIKSASTMVAHLLPTRTVFICDAHVTMEPTAEEIVQMTELAAQEVRRFNMEPKIALLSHSNFGTSAEPSAQKMRDALQILHKTRPDLEVDGEMHSDAALIENIRNRLYPNSKLTGAANLLVMPNGDASNISVNLLKILGGGTMVGPILMGMDKSAHVVTQSVTVRSLVNMSALAVVQALRDDEDCQAAVELPGQIA
jgi:malate dehydrogenase (oxaloacetate-decarboxylating)(NADP+)